MNEPISITKPFLALGGNIFSGLKLLSLLKLPYYFIL
jgi:hypothetical protein